MFTTVFSPSVGGIERISETLCREWTAMGHEVRLATLTPGGADFPFQVIRKPRLLDWTECLRWCDVHVQANVALRQIGPRIMAGRRCVYQHHSNYRRDDGTSSMLDRVKRAVARHSNGIAVSRFTARMTGAQHVVMNAYNDAVFRSESPWGDRPGTLVFLGRLVSQKGCDTLLDALGYLAKQGLRPDLTIVGDGPDRTMLVDSASRQGLADQVTFLGLRTGADLATVLNAHRYVVTPSHYEEPFGIAALEGLSCGCVPVVSERGGLVEAIGGHGFSFPNGDVAALATVLAEALQSPMVAHARLDGVESHLARCTARRVAEQYLAIFQQQVCSS